MALKVTYQGTDVVVEEGSNLLIGAGEGSDIRISRPGISRRHAAVAFDGGKWKVEDAGSRNGVFANGQRVHVTTIDAPTNLVLGHPTDGEVISFTPLAAPSAASSTVVQAEIDAFVLPETPPPSPPPVARTPRAAAPAVAAVAPTRSVSTQHDVDLSAAIRDQIAAIKGLTWSVWAMIAVTAALCVLTLFVGILAN